jgi:EmrB/QacA subfamily drug resistance transporter
MWGVTQFSDRARSRITAISVSSGMLMEFIDSTALGNALPAMGRYFHLPPAELNLALSAYVLALALFIPASGWLGDRFGARRVYLIAISIFAFGSILCAVSHSVPFLVAARVVQGLGGSMMTPVARTIIVSSTPRSELVEAMSWFTTPATLGPLLGPPLAGFLLVWGDWRSIFLINLPVALIGAVLVSLFAPDAKGTLKRPFDWLGFILSGTTMTMFVITLELPGDGAPLDQIVFAGGIAIALLAIYLVQAVHTPHPVLNLRLFTQRTFRASIVVGSIMRLGLGSAPLLLPLLLQLGLGWSPVKTGFVIIAQVAGVIIAKLTSARLVTRFGYARVLMIGAIANCVMSAVPAFFRPETPLVIIVGLLAITGWVRSTFFTSNTSVAFAELRHDQVSQAAALSSVLQQVGMVFGISVGAWLLHGELAGALAYGSVLSHYSFPFLIIGGAMTAGVFFIGPEPEGEKKLVEAE